MNTIPSRLDDTLTCGLIAVLLAVMPLLMATSTPATDGLAATSVASATTAAR